MFELDGRIVDELELLRVPREVVLLEEDMLLLLKDNDSDFVLETEIEWDKVELEVLESGGARA